MRGLLCVSVDLKNLFYCHGTGVTVTQNARTRMRCEAALLRIDYTAVQDNKTPHRAFVCGCGRDRSKDIFLSADKDTAEKWWISAVRFGASRGSDLVKASIASGSPPAPHWGSGGAEACWLVANPGPPIRRKEKMRSRAPQREASRFVTEPKIGGR